eukprot:3483084-Pyramimonas_sp.AAC.2
MVLLRVFNAGRNHRDLRNTPSDLSIHVKTRPWQGLQPQESRFIVTPSKGSTRRFFQRREFLPRRSSIQNTKVQTQNKKPQTVIRAHQGQIR